MRLNEAPPRRPSPFQLELLGLASVDVEGQGIALL